MLMTSSTRWRSSPATAPPPSPRRSPTSDTALRKLFSSLVLVSGPGRAHVDDPLAEGLERRATLERCLGRRGHDRHADVGDLGQAERHLEEGHVELRVVGEDGDHGAPVQSTGVALLLEVAMRPLDDDLVGLREAGVDGEDRSCVADGDVVAQEVFSLARATAAAKLHRPEHEHPRLLARTTTRRPACPRPAVHRRGRRRAWRSPRWPAGPRRRRGRRRPHGASRGSRTRRASSRRDG